MDSLLTLLIIAILTTLSLVSGSGQQTLHREKVSCTEADPIMRNCLDIQRHFKNSTDGLYTIFPFDCYPERPVHVYCDMTTNGGGWTVIQRRDDIQPREIFYRRWMEYALGFGNLNGEFWLGLDIIHALTDQALNEIRFDLMDFDNVSRWAQYDFFYIYDRENKFKLEVSGYTGDAGNSFTRHDLQSFTTKDKDLDDDYDSNCAKIYHGAWWYHHCVNANLNGLPYEEGQHESVVDGIFWEEFHGRKYSLKKTEMKVRPVNMY